MPALYEPAVTAATKVLSDYRKNHPGEPFPTIVGKLAPILEAHSTVDRVKPKLFKERMDPIVGQVRRYKKFETAYSAEQEHGLIFICPSLDLEYRRFIRLKEAGHLILDKPEDYVHNETEIDRLMVQLAQFGGEDLSRQFLSEQCATIFAIETLFPKPVRDVIRAGFGKGTPSVPTLVEAARVPATYIRFAMSEWYHEKIDTMYGKANPLISVPSAVPPSKGVSQIDDESVAKKANPGSQG